MTKFFKFFMAVVALAVLSTPALAAWEIVAGADSGCTTCGILETKESAVAFRIKLIGDGTTSTEAENLLVPTKGYQSLYLEDILIETPAAGGPTGTWNLTIQDSETDKVIVEKTAIDNTASSETDIGGYEKTGKFERMLGQPRIVVSDTDLGSTEYVYIVLTFSE